MAGKEWAELARKIEKVTSQKEMDLSSGEDLSIGIMNLISLEEHFFFTAMKTGKRKYLLLLKEVREMRKSLLRELVREPEGEVWCISKHLLAAAMRLMEVGTKKLGEGKPAQDYFRRGYQLYGIFWALNLGVIDSRALSKKEKKELEKLGREEHYGEKGFFGRLGEMISKAIDCCKE